jgi:protein-tyrosine phosphatase
VARAAHDPSAGVSERFSIAFICTGNRFRSPLARAFVERLTLGLPIQIETAGTLEIVAAPALPEALHLAMLCGVDLSRHRSQPLGSVPLDDVDLVLGFDQEHVRSAVVEAGADRSRSFTFREFVGLLGYVSQVDGASPLERARKAVRDAEDLRRAGAPFGGALVDIPDSFGNAPEAYRECAVEIRELSLALVDHLFGLGRATLLPVPERLPGPGWLTRSRRSFIRRREPV